MTVTVEPRHPLHPDALAMIAGSEAELAAIYRPELRYAFSPQQLVDAAVAFRVAYRDRVPVGCGGMAACAGYGELKRMYVIPEARGTGVAPALIAALEAEARAQGLPLMRLETGSASPAAIRLYGREGYVLRPPFGEYVKNGSSVFMEKRL